MMAKFNKVLSHMESLGVIIRVEESTDWYVDIVVVLKKTGGMHVWNTWDRSQNIL